MAADRIGRPVDRRTDEKSVQQHKRKHQQRHGTAGHEHKHEQRKPKRNNERNHNRKRWKRNNRQHRCTGFNPANSNGKPDRKQRRTGSRVQRRTGSNSKQPANRYVELCKRPEHAIKHRCKRAEPRKPDQRTEVQQRRSCSTTGMG